MEPITVKASIRSDRGKGAARRMRRADQIPAVAYGKELKPVALAVSPKSLKEAILGKFGLNCVIKLEIEGGESFHTLVAEHQYHPVSRELLHADFLRIDMSKPVDIDVPFELKGRAKGVVLGGELRQVYRKLPVTCMPGQIPEKIVLDVSDLGLDDSVSVKGLSLPEGVTVRMGENRTVAAVVAGRKAKAAEAEAEDAAKA
ncbi:MAG: 50S ribosomal protein L25 [Polyangiaceae bacterium]|nr:50S ribosomal protein L25 [Polyangiaceae bacterium]MCB9606968.1 50S ribosomal protein L25 [Polyangiaceae bacterium]